MQHPDPIPRRSGKLGRARAGLRAVSQKDISFDGNSQQPTSIFDIIFTGSYNSIQSKEQESK